MRERDELMGVLYLEDALPQYLIHAMFVGAETVAVCMTASLVVYIVIFWLESVIDRVGLQRGEVNRLCEL